MIALRRAVVGLLGLVGMANAQTYTTTPGFDVLREYDLKGLGHSNTSLINDRHGGGFIDPSDPNFLFLAVNTESEKGAVWRIPLTRDLTTGKIISMDGLAATKAFDQPYMDHFSVNKGPNDKWFYTFMNPSASDNPNALTGGCGRAENTTKCWYDPPTDMCYGTYETASQNLINRGQCVDGAVWKTLSGANWTYDVPGSNRTESQTFQGPLGLGFYEPTAALDMVCTSSYGFFRINLDSSYTPTSVELLAQLSSGYPGGLGFAPSGTLNYFAFINDWSSEQVFLLHMNRATGNVIDQVTNSEALPTNNPKTTLFVNGTDFKPWGYFVDPLTNDYFITQWEDSTSITASGKILHFEGFPPGYDENVLLTGLGKAAAGIFGNRRDLSEEERQQLDLSDEKRQLRGPLPGHGPPICPPGGRGKGLINRPVFESCVLQPGIIQSCKQMKKRLKRAYASRDPINFSAAVMDPVTLVLQSSAYGDVLMGRNPAPYYNMLEPIECGIQSFKDGIPPGATNYEPIQGALGTTLTQFQLFKELPEDPVIRENFNLGGGT